MRMGLLVLALAAGVAMAAPTVASAQRAHRVRQGDTLSSIARRYGVTVASLRTANRLRGDGIRVGVRLRIPRRGRGARRNIPARRYQVRPGDTLARIARRFRVTVQAIQVANRMGSRTVVRPSERLWVPRRGVDPRRVAAAARGENAVRVADATPGLDEAGREAADARKEALGLGTNRVANTLLMESPDPRWVEAAAEAGELAEGTLALPVDEGRFLRGWGSGPGGYHLAVDIGAPSGTPVHAAAPGIVAYAGRGLSGYGNLVILVHANGWVTAYAHHRRNLVVAGQLVATGDTIAEVGATGLARGPHLHFVLVKDGRHCDPVPLYRPGIRRVNGELVETEETTWVEADVPPQIECRTRAERPHPYR